MLRTHYRRKNRPYVENGNTSSGYCQEDSCRWKTGKSNNPTSSEHAPILPQLLAAGNIGVSGFFFFFIVSRSINTPTPLKIATKVLALLVHLENVFVFNRNGSKIRRCNLLFGQAKHISVLTVVGLHVTVKPSLRG